MLTRRHALAVLGSAAIVPAAGSGARAQGVPVGYPADYARIVEAARKEAKLVVYSPTDAAQARPLMQAFRTVYPEVGIDWNDLNTNVAYNRVISEAAASQMGGDIVWSPAMDLQLNIVERGIAATYASPEAGKLPAWARFKDAAYGSTVEPAALLFNKGLFPAERVPRTRVDLIKLLTERKDELKGKVCTFDPEKSGTGFMWSTADARNTPNFWDFARAFGAAEGKTYSSSGQMREKVLSGEHLLGINMFASYALDWARKSQSLGVVFSTDQTPAISRVVLVTKDAPHPNAGRLFLDFMLSARGQQAMGEGGLPSIRSDISGVETLETMTKAAGGNLKPIALDNTILEMLDPKRRTDFLGQWKKALTG